MEFQDLKYSPRTFRRSPGFMIAAVAALAPGIRANTAILSVFSGIPMQLDLNTSDQGHYFQAAGRLRARVPITQAKVRVQASAIVLHRTGGLVESLRARFNDPRSSEGLIPLRRIASADDVAGPIIFLCSQYVRHMTGEVVSINGGALLLG